VVNEQVQFSGGDALIGFSASAWSSVGGQLLTYELWLDGQPTGGQLAMYANYESVHLALGHTWVYVPGLTAGAHEVSLLAGPNTVTDGNDTASITVWELGDGCAVSFAGDAAPPASGDGQMFFKEAVHSQGQQLLISASCSGWSSGSGIVGATALFDGNLALTTEVFANAANEHLATVPTDVVVTEAVGHGQHLVTLSSEAATATDSGDLGHLAVVDWVNAADAPVAVPMSPPLQNAQALTQSGDGGTIQSAVFTSNGGPLLVKVGVSAWTQSAPTILYCGIQIDGTSQGFASIFANNSQTHMAMVTNPLVLTNVPAGNHALNLMAEANVVTDQNDRVSVMILEFPSS
jgi:hypothetical protein